MNRAPVAVTICTDGVQAKVHSAIRNAGRHGHRQQNRIPCDNGPRPGGQQVPIEERQLGRVRRPLGREPDVQLHFVEYLGQCLRIFDPELTPFFLDQHQQSNDRLLVTDKVHGVQAEILGFWCLKLGQKRDIWQDGTVCRQQVTGGETAFLVVQFRRERDQMLFGKHNIDGIEPEIESDIKCTQQITVPGTYRDTTTGDRPSQQVPIRDDRVSVRWNGPSGKKVLFR